MLLLRSVLFNTLLYTFTAICSVIAAGIAILAPSRLHDFSAWWSGRWLALYKSICGVSLRVTGRENLPPGACILAMKHQSTWDTFALFAIFNKPIFVLKDELKWVPVFGWVLRQLGCIFVKRGTGKSAIDSMVRGAREAVQRGNQIVIFPEGTRSTPGIPSEYKSGVSHLYKSLQVQCVPVALNSGLVWPRRKFLRPPGIITVQILTPIPPGVARQQMFTQLVSDIESASKRLAATAAAANAD